MKASKDTFGFIKVDDGTEMFVLPGSCPSFGSKILAIGTRVTFGSVIDTKTNKIRATAVTLEDNSNPEATTSQHSELRTHFSTHPITKPIRS